MKSWKIKSWIQHTFNPVHIYCRLVGIIGKKYAKKVGVAYECVIWNLLYN